MSAERYHPDLSAEHHAAIAVALCVRKVDLQLAVRDSSARLERARAAKDDDAAAMAEESLATNRDQLVALEAAQHAFLNARRCRPQPARARR